MWFSSLLIKKEEAWDCFVDKLYEPERTENWLKVCKRLSLIPQVGFPQGYSVIVTHNENGEYGHVKHREIHRKAVKADVNLLVPTYPSGHEIDVEAKRELIKFYDDPTRNHKHRWQSLLKNYNWKIEGFRFIRLSS